MRRAYGKRVRGIVLSIRATGCFNFLEAVIDFRNRNTQYGLDISFGCTWQTYYQHHDRDEYLSEHMSDRLYHLLV